jgi:GntR family transcriptional regulator
MSTASVKYPIVRAGMLEQVAAMKPHDLLPNERELAQQFGVSRMTLRRALKELADDGLLYAVRGQGTFIAEQRISKGSDLTSFSEDMRARGLTPSARLISAHVVEAPETVAYELELDPGAAVFEVVRVRLADRLPMCIEHSHLPERFFRGLLEHDLQGSLHEILRTAFRTQAVRAEQTMSAATLTSHQADLLGAKRGAAALRVQRITSDSRGRLIERSTSVYRGDRYDFHLTIARSGR